MKGRLITRITGIQPGERTRSLLMFSYIFFIIASLLIVKPVRNSLFLTRFGATALPYVYILVALSAGFITSLYDRFSRKFRLDFIILCTLFFSAAVFLLFWRMFRLESKPGWMLYAFYIWVQIYGVIATTQFWLLANYVFNAREARRLFSFIGAGAIAGGIAGGYITRWLVPAVGTVNLLLISILFLVFCAAILQAIRIVSKRKDFAENTKQEKGEESTRAWKLVLESRYLRIVAGIVGIGVLTANLVDYQFSAIATSTIRDGDQLTGFFGFWLSNLSVISLLIQFLLTGRILISLGVTASLFFLPFGILGGAFATLLRPSLWTGILIKIMDGGFKQSINKAGMELLYLPLPSRIKTQAKAFIDVFVDSFSEGLGGCLLLLFSYFITTDVRSISILIVALICIWFALIIMAKEEYINAFRLAIEKRTIDLDEQSIDLNDAAAFGFLTRVLEENNERKILYVLNLVENSKADSLVPYLKKLSHHPSSEIRAQTLNMIQNFPNVDFSEEVLPLVEDSDDEVRVLAIRHLSDHSLDKHARMREYLQHPRRDVRTSALMAAAVEWKQDSNFRKKFSLENEFREFLNEMQHWSDDDEKEKGRMCAAKVVGEAGDKELFPYLHVLIGDSSASVQQAAVRAAGSTSAPEFIPVLIRFLDQVGLRIDARKSLSLYGKDAVQLMTERLLDTNEKQPIRRGIPRALAMIGTQESMDALTHGLDLDDFLLHYQVIKSLSILRSQFPLLQVDKEKITNKILDETKNYHRTLLVLHAESNRLAGEEQVNDARRLLIRALEERLDDNLERIFRLLGLRYQMSDMFNAYKGIKSRKEDLRANAVEFLDNVLDSDLKRSILPIIEGGRLDARMARIRSLYPADVPDETESLVSFLEGEDQWLRVCALFLVARLKDKNLISPVARLVNSEDPIVKETAEFALRAMQVPVN